MMILNELKRLFQELKEERERARREKELKHKLFLVMYQNALDNMLEQNKKNKKGKK